MKVSDHLFVVISQAEFAHIIGVSEATVSGLVAEGTLVKGEPVCDWLKAYCLRLREVAAGRASAESGGLDLVQERAALARTQRQGLEIKNEVARKTYAPVEALATVLATASQQVVECFEMLPAQIATSMPDLPHEVTDLLVTAIAEARNKWVKTTSSLLLPEETSPEDDADDQIEEDFS